MVLDKIKRKLLNAIWPHGSIATIRRGYLKGYKILISDNSGWSPIAGRWEPASQKLFSKVVKPGQVVFDLGANNGVHSLLFAKLVGENGKVIAFEPLQDNIVELQKNYSLNDIRNIEVASYAVGKTNGKVSFKLGLHNKQGSLVGIGRESGREIEVELVTLKSFINDRNVVPDFIKIDIEGAESDALEGMDDMIARMQPIFFIELHTPEQDIRVGKILLKNGYEAYRLIEKGSSDKLLEKVERMDASRPAPKAMWGSVLAVHSSKNEIVKGLV